MPDRTGSLSSFPTSVDQFAIKKPIDPQKSLNQQNIEALEKASHMNHMFDAMYKIESHILGGSGGIGASVVTRWATGATGSSSDVYGSNLKMAYSTLSISMTGNTAVVTGLVPTAFGSNPFYAKGFAMSHNFYLNNTAVSGGMYANNKNWGQNGAFNEMMKFHQFFTFVRPLTGSSGRQFEVMVKNFPFHSTSEQISSVFTDTLLNFNLDYQPLWQRSGWAGTGANGAISASKTINNFEYLIISCFGNGHQFSPPIQTGGQANYGWVWPTTLGKMSDSYVEWGAIDSTIMNLVGYVGERYSRLGPMTRANGTLTNASFYCVAIGDVPSNAGGLTGNLARYATILKVTGANLTVSEVTLTSSAWSAGTVAPITNGATSSSGYFWFGSLGVRYRLKCETVPGSAKITVEQAFAPYSSWTTLYGPFYDGTSPLASGYSGFFSQAHGTGNGYSPTSRWIRFNDSVAVGNLLSTSQITGEVQLMFMLAGPESNITMEVG